ncbi:hypothetical protein ACLOJK_032279 [Asimina triloba]
MRKHRRSRLPLLLLKKTPSSHVFYLYVYLVGAKEDPLRAKFFAGNDFWEDVISMADNDEDEENGNNDVQFCDGFLAGG